MNVQSTSAKDRDVASKTASKEAGAAIKSDILVERRGDAGLITLNRPKALNALSLQMVRDLSSILRTWRDDIILHLHLLCLPRNSL